MAFNKRTVTIEYIANEGVLLNNRGKKILIDGVHTKHVPPYFRTSDKVLECLKNGIAPYDRIDLLVFTHHHSEHFDADAVCDILKNNRLTHLLCTMTIRQKLFESLSFDPIIVSQIHSFDIPKYASLIASIKDVPFEVISLMHDGKNYTDVENYVYNFELGDKIFMHLGDSLPSVENFEKGKMFDKDVDVLFAPFPYLGLRAGREILKRMNPKRIVIVHLPDSEQDKAKWIENTIRIYRNHKKELPPIDMFLNVGEEMTIR